MISNLFHNIILATEQTALLHILLSIVSVIVLTTIAAWINAWLRPAKPSVEKLTTYESGMEPIGNAWGPINSRLSALGLIFILFELETVLLFPWASIWIKAEKSSITSSVWNLYMAMSGTFFILVLSIGLVYVIIKGQQALSGGKISSQQVVVPHSKVPMSYYEKINAKYADPHQIVNNQED